jgi:hypothetical protein
MKAHWLRRPIWWLSALWVVLGAAGSGYLFLVSTQPISMAVNLGDSPAWIREPSVVLTAATLGGWVWVALTIPVLVAGLIQIRGWKPGKRIGVAAWAGAWVAGLVLMVLVWEWQVFPPEFYVGREYVSPIVAWRELPVCAAFLALGAVMTRLLAE